MSSYPHGEVSPIDLASLANAVVHQLAASTAPIGDVHMTQLTQFTNALELPAEESQRIWVELRAAVLLWRAGDALTANNLIHWAFASSASCTTLKGLPAPPEPKVRHAPKRKAKPTRKRAKR